MLHAVARGEAADIEMRDSALPQVYKERLALKGVPFESLRHDREAIVHLRDARGRPRRPLRFPTLRP